MSDAAPKPWVKALRIKSTPWRVLVGLWGHGSYKADGPAFVWVNRRKLADEVGLPLETCKNGLRALAALGWVRRRGGGWDLAWMEPEAFARSAEDTTRSTGDTVHPRHDPVHGEHDPVRPRHGTRSAGDTHNVAGNFQLPSNQVGDASARPPTDKCGLCTLVGHARRYHPDCERHSHRDPGDLPRAHEEHPHGHTPRPNHDSGGAESDAHSVKRGVVRAHTGPEEHAHCDTPENHNPRHPRELATGHRGGAAPRHPGLQGCTAEGDVLGDPRHALPTHVQRSLTRATGDAGPDIGHRLQHAKGPGPASYSQSEPESTWTHARTAGALPGATRHDNRVPANADCAPRHHPGAPGLRADGDDTRGAGGHRGRGDGARLGRGAALPAGRLSPELTEAVAAAGDVWGAQLGHQRFEHLVLECVDDLGLTPEELTRGLLGWETADRRSRPPRSQWLYGRNRPAFKLEAGLGDGKPSRFSTAAGEAEIIPLDWGREATS